jgi:inositol 1,4,5-triphosphate receptor type 2
LTPSSRTSGSNSFDTRQLNAKSSLLFEIKLKIIDIFEFILSVRLDYRLTYLLSVFKKYYESKDKKSASSAASLGIKEVIEEANRLFVGEIGVDLLDLDGEGGKKFLKVLIKLTMQEYPLLANGALKLMFRHFSQIQETLAALKQVLKYLYIRI